jgi:oligosaccharide translocation protein RFT1
VFVAYHCGSRPRVLLALPRVGRARFDPPTLALWRTVLVQTAFKQVLTEGDRLMMNYICSVEDQGVYLVVTNYGSLVARLLLQPVEELLRLYLTRSFAAADSAATATAKRVMQHVCLAYVVLAAIIALGGYPSASYLLRVVLGARSAEWLRATNLFAVFPQYVLYIPLLAFNGVLEAFFSSVATPREIAAHSRFMFALTLAYLATMYFLVAHCQRGLLGLIVANAINMALRILYCTVFVLRFFGDVSVGAILSAAAVPVLVALAVGAFEYFAIGYVASFGQLVRSAACCGFYVATMAVYERRLVAEAIRSFKSKQE